MKLTMIVAAVVVVLAGCAPVEDTFDATKYGPDDPWAARGSGLSLSHRAEIYQAQGNFGQSELFYKRSIAVYEYALGTDARELVTPLNNLATLYMGKKRYAEAEPLLVRAEAVAKKNGFPFSFIVENLAKTREEMNKRK